MVKTGRVSWDNHARCWREDPNGNHDGVFFDNIGWRVIWNLHDAS